MKLLILLELSASESRMRCQIFSYEHGEGSRESAGELKNLLLIGKIVVSHLIGEDPSSKSMGFDKDGAVVDSEASETKTTSKMPANGEGQHHGFSIKASETCLCPTEGDDDDDDDDEDEEREIELGPKCTLKEQLEKDKDDESLRRWKEQLLGLLISKKLEPDVKILSLAIKSPGRPDMVLTIPENGKPKGSWFTLKEGSKYCLKFTFQVSNNIVSRLKYTNMVWKTSVKVDSTKEMIGTFSPQTEPYTHEISEETTPSGMFARGSYSARSKFVDDDNKCYLKINYSFDVHKEWQS
ncbi:Rho GDP-dissociation inhibitor 1 [Hibiscus syriacus]|uniref:Rho GDP-dissociation inhibitor 1 n=1 Tax=Hibiscus syriacus TaxID=106335 RepID=A0A6A2ZYU5_HIBSY|nr:Rho GDP-dissociation inhibitor 1 [Hibiscus syriacus]